MLRPARPQSCVSGGMCGRVWARCCGVGVPASRVQDPCCCHAQLLASSPSACHRPCTTSWGPGCSGSGGGGGRGGASRGGGGAAAPRRVLVAAGPPQAQGRPPGLPAAARSTAAAASLFAALLLPRAAAAATLPLLLLRHLLRLEPEAGLRRQGRVPVQQLLSTASWHLVAAQTPQDAGRSQSALFRSVDEVDVAASPVARRYRSPPLAALAPAVPQPPACSIERSLKVTARIARATPAS